MNLSYRQSCFCQLLRTELFLESNLLQFLAILRLVLPVLGLGLRKSYLAFDIFGPQRAFLVRLLCHELLKLTWPTPPALNVFKASLLPFFLPCRDVPFLSFTPCQYARVPSRLRARSVLFPFPLLDPYARVPFVVAAQFSKFLHLIFAFLFELVVKLSYFFRLTADHPSAFATWVCPILFEVAMLL